MKNKSKYFTDEFTETLQGIFDLGIERIVISVHAGGSLTIQPDTKEYFKKKGVGGGK